MFHRSRILIMISLLTTASVFAFAFVSGTESGDYQIAREGCGGEINCHGFESDGRTSTYLTGIPSIYEPENEYYITVVVQSTLVAGDKGGFALEVTEGNLTSADNNVQIDPTEKKASQTGQNDSRTWDLTWKAPTEGTGRVSFYLSGAAVDGNNNASSSDSWDLYTDVSEESGTIVEGGNWVGWSLLVGENLWFPFAIIFTFLALPTTGWLIFFVENSKELTVRSRIIGTTIRLVLAAIFLGIAFHFWILVEPF